MAKWKSPFDPGYKLYSIFVQFICCLKLFGKTTQGSQIIIPIVKIIIIMAPTSLSKKNRNYVFYIAKFHAMLR